MNIQMEFTNRCNLSCVECPNRFMQRKREDMSMEVFKTVLHDYIERLNPGTIIVHKDGEPLLHKNFSLYLDMISKVTNAKIDIYTNGLYLTEDLINFLHLLPNPIWLLVSFHFFSDKAMEYDYSNTIEILESFVDKPRKNVDIILTTHLTDLADMFTLEFWKEKWSENITENSMLRTVHVNTAINPWAGRIKQEAMSVFTHCPYSDGEHLFIGNTGNVLSCCMDLEEEVVFGNIMNDSFDQIMEKRNQFYFYMRKRMIKDEICKKCLNLS